MVVKHFVANYCRLNAASRRDEHVGYRWMNFPNLKFSIVGGWPFSCGGEQLYRKKLLTARYGIHDMNESAKMIYQTALRTPEDHSVVFLAHNGANRARLQCE